MDVPEYIRLISEWKYDESYDLTRETKPFPSVCGRICYHSCESVCKKGDTDEPVAINDLKGSVTDYDQSHNNKDLQSRIRVREERVAIVGLGPAGLTAAHDLSK